MIIDMKSHKCLTVGNTSESHYYDEHDDSVSAGGLLKLCKYRSKDINNSKRDKNIKHTEFKYKVYIL